MFSKILAIARHAVPSTQAVFDREASSSTARPKSGATDDHRLDVVAVAVAEFGEHLVVDRVEFFGEFFEFLLAQPGERAFHSSGHLAPFITVRVERHLRQCG